MRSIGGSCKPSLGARPAGGDARHLPQRSTGQRQRLIMRETALAVTFDGAVAHRWRPAHCRVERQEGRGLSTPLRAARIAAIGAGTPVHISNASAAWYSSIPNPPSVVAPRASAASSSAVRSGW